MYYTYTPKYFTKNIHIQTSKKYLILFSCLNMYILIYLNINNLTKLFYYYGHIIPLWPEWENVYCLPEKQTP